MLRSMVSIVQEESFAMGEPVIRHSAKVTSLYVIVEGQAKVSMCIRQAAPDKAKETNVHHTNQSRMVEVALVGPAETFGFLDCVDNVGSAEAITAATKELRVWKLPMFSLSRLLGERLSGRIRQVATQVTAICVHAFVCARCMH
jgi:hypothetical protein